jgi:hypothetical protein
MRFIDQTDPTEFHDETRDIPNQRIVYLQGGRQIKLERKDPYGFVFIGWDKGSPPAALQSAFTDFSQARQALDLYISNNTFDETSDEPTTKAPELKYKKKFRNSTTDENLVV